MSEKLCQPMNETKKEMRCAALKCIHNFEVGWRSTHCFKETIGGLRDMIDENGKCKFYDTDETKARLEAKIMFKRLIDEGGVLK